MAKKSAFFLLVFALALINSCSDNPSAPEKITPYPCTDHWTDADMRTERDDNAVPVDSIFEAWIVTNHQPIRSLTSDCFADLQFLKQAIGERRLVQLGESGHGVSEFNQVKVRLIKFLHQQMGFDVIAFESAIYECFMADSLQDSLTAEGLMRHSIFPVWHAEETLPLFEYIKETHATGRPLTLAGFDIQISSLLCADTRPEFLRDVLGQVNPVFADKVFKYDSTIVAEDRKSWYGLIDFVKANYYDYLITYETLYSHLGLKMDSLMSVYADRPEVPKIARRTAYSMTKYLPILNSYETSADHPASNQAISIRDLAMAYNLDYLVTDLFPGKKIIVWAHNYHIMHDYQTMGAIIKNKHRPDLYTVGLIMYRGQAAYNNRQLYDVLPPTAGSIESIFYCPRRKHCFVDMLGQTREPGNAWMFETRPLKSWGLSEYSIIPRQQYDAFLFIDTVHPPDYLPYTTFQLMGEQGSPPNVPIASGGRTQ